MFKKNQYYLRIKHTLLMIKLQSFYYGLVLFCIVLFSCDVKKNERGYEYYPSMVYSEAYETYAPNTVFPDGKTAQPPVPGTIPRHMIPHQYPNTAEGQKLAGLELINPFEPNEENIARGKKEYDVFCANCHGYDGRGDGNMFTSGKYPSEPPSLITEEMLKMPDGEYYHIMTVGSAIMGPFASLIRPQDKWKIIIYIKHELAKREKNKIT